MKADRKCREGRHRKVLKAVRKYFEGCQKVFRRLSESVVKSKD